MDPLSSLPALTQALLLRQGMPPAEAEALLRAVGQELALTFLGTSAEGVRLEFPGGRQVTAQGEVPFPAGTQMKVRVLQEGGALKLQTLEATPPRLPSLLAPLAQSEAPALLARLQQQPLPELAPLVNLLRLLEEGPEPEPEPLTEARVSREAEALPQAARTALATVLESTPAEVPTALVRYLLGGRPGGNSAELQPALPDLLDRAELPPAVRREVESLLRTLVAKPSEAQVGRQLATLPREVIARLATALGVEPAELPVALLRLVRPEGGPAQPGQNHGPTFADLPPEARAVLVSIQRLPPEQRTPAVFERELAILPREVLTRLAEALQTEPAEVPSLLSRALTAPILREAAILEPSARLLLLVGKPELPLEARGPLEALFRNLFSRDSPEAPPPRELPLEGSRILPRAELAKVVTALKAQSLAPPEVPAVWEAWVKGSVRALADPDLSPREAPFHALQARESTAYFEIPLPWAAGKALQLWVEEDDSGSRPEGQEPTSRLLLGLSLSRLGETRVGLQRQGGALSVRIWTEHPELVQGQREQVEQELRGLGMAVDLRILPLQGGVPDLRALVRGTGLHALG